MMDEHNSTDQKKASSNGSHRLPTREEATRKLMEAVAAANAKVSPTEMIRRMLLEEVAVEVLSVEISLEDEMVRDHVPNYFSPVELITFRAVKDLDKETQEWFSASEPVKAVRAMKQSPSFSILLKYGCCTGHISRIDFPAIKKDLEKLGPARTEKEKATMEAIKEVMSFLENNDYHQSLIANYNKRFLD